MWVVWTQIAETPGVDFALFPRHARFNSWTQLSTTWIFLVCSLSNDEIRQDGLPQLPPTLRGVRVRGTNPREVVAFQGC